MQIARAIAAFVLAASAFAGQEAAFRVHVVGPNYENIEKAKLELRAADGEARSARTDARGNTVLEGVRPGPYVVRIEVPGFVVWLRKHYEVEYPQTRPLLATLHVGSTGSCGPPERVDYDNTEPTGVRVQGVVLGSRRKGIRGATLSIWAANEKEPRSVVRSGKEGVFAMSDIAPGKYKLRITRKHYKDLEFGLAVPPTDAVRLTVDLLRIGSVQLCQ